MMSCRKFVALIVCSFMLIGHGFAQEDWKFSIGINHRTIDNVDFEPFAFRNTAFPGSRYVNGTITDAGSLTDDDGDGLFDNAIIVDPSQTTPALFDGTGTAIAGVLNSQVTFDRVTFGGMDTKFDNAIGFVLGASKLLQDTVTFKWNLDLSLATAFSQMDKRGRPIVVTETSLVANPVPDINGIIDGTFSTPSSAGDPTTISTLNYDLDLSLYTFGAGLSGAYQMKGLILNFGVGPTLSIADLDVERVTNSKVIATGASVGPKKVNDDSTDFVLGLYFNVGLEYDINDSFGIALDYRFDQVFDDVTTNLADVDLDGSSTQLKLIYSF